MGQTISSDIIRICKGCGKEFHPHARKQFYCNEEIEKTCVYCGTSFRTICTSSSKITCSTSCQANYIKQKRMKSAANLVKVCKWCGNEFHPNSVRDVYCYDTHYQTCEVCGSKFEIDLRKDPYVKTCSLECKKILALRNRNIESEQQHLKQTLLVRYGVDNSMKIPSSIDRIKSTNLERYGVDWYTQTEEYKSRLKQTDLQKYGVEHHLQNTSVISKRVSTVQKLYGSSNVFSSEYGKFKVKQTLQERYGVDNPSQYFEFKRKATANSRHSKLEIRVQDLFNNYNIEYVYHYFLASSKISHEFDFYLPKYKVLIDADGLYYHSYLDDPDGKHVNDYYDDIRLSLVPEDCMFFLLVEGSEDVQIKELVKILENIDKDIFNYDSYLFDWCRSIEFPYPSYTVDRIQRDYQHLVDLDVMEYNPKSRLASSAINQYHKSLYDANVAGKLSPRQGWYDDKILKSAIKNRLIYKNNVDPSKILAGFSISKLCPRVSVFNPVLAKYLVTKYLSNFSTVFDPFSGYSGRLLGTCASGKTYIGQDVNSIAVAESNEIINALKLDQGSVVCQDVLEDSMHSYECLLTCPPYNMKEHYSSEDVYKSCDQWITYILNKYTCKRYVFVVDDTLQYINQVVETLRSTSHFSEVTERVIVIDNEY